MMKYLVVLFLLFAPSIRGSRKIPRVIHDVPWDPEITYQLQFGQIHTIDVVVDQYMDIFCPQYDADDRSSMQFIIYNVSQKSFDECSMAADAKQIFECDSPSISKKLTTKFQRRSPNPMGFVFKPGHSYYYMSFFGVENGQYSCDKALRMAINVHHKKSHVHTKASLPATHSVIQTTKSKAATTTQTTTSSKPLSSKTTTKTSSLAFTKTSTKLNSVGQTKKLKSPGGNAASVKCSHFWIISTCFLAIFLHT